MGFDFYTEFAVQSRADVDQLTLGSGRYKEILDVSSRALLLSTVRFPDQKGKPDKIDPKDYARSGERNIPSRLKLLVHSSKSFNLAINCSLSQMAVLDLMKRPALDGLPTGSWLLEFPVTLSKPFISRDDIPLYIIDNPVRKDKVFTVPFISPAAWKGNLRWVMMKSNIEPKTDDFDAFASSRFHHTLLFGTEKGLEEIPKGWVRYLDELCPEAAQIYKNKLQEHFQLNEGTLPHIRGMLHFYPAFWNRVDMEVINPHNRQTGAGTIPIHFETVPVGATGVFRLVYVPFYWLNFSDRERISHSLQDLGSVVKGLEELMLTYGFSAKKSSGFGVIKDNWNPSASNITIVGLTDKPGQFGNFKELSCLVECMQKEAVK
ncbi:MAG TPA: CRISPR-associated protein [Desulfotomaculum sp.]|nr:CRISPR-associated protein [Desulfotomaculum sp.]